MKKISGFIGKYMAVIVLVVASLALFAPGTCTWIRTGWINYLLMLFLQTVLCLRRSTLSGLLLSVRQLMVILPSVKIRVIRLVLIV